MFWLVLGVGYAVDPITVAESQAATEIALLLEQRGLRQQVKVIEKLGGI